MKPEEAYRVLNLDSAATPEAIAKAYRELLRVWQPDRFPADIRLQMIGEQKLKLVNEAYEALTGGGQEPAPPAAQPKPAPQVAAKAPEEPSRPARWRRPWELIPRSMLPVLPLLLLLAAFLGTSAILFLRFLPPPVEVNPATAHPAQPPHVAARPPQVHVAPPAHPARHNRETAGGGVERPVSGADLAPATPAGSGAIQITNATDLDAVVSLVSGTHAEAPRRLVYVRSGEPTTLRNVGVGVYYLRFAVGHDWRPSARQFARDRAQTGLIGPLQFIQIASTEGVAGDTYNVVLKPNMVGR